VILYFLNCNSHITTHQFYYYGEILLNADTYTKLKISTAAVLTHLTLLPTTPPPPPAIYQAILH